MDPHSNHNREQDPWAQWFELATSPETRHDLEHALEDIYNEAARRTKAGGGRCRQSGRCCRFESYGHRLYVTGLEAAWFLTRTLEPAGLAPGHAGRSGSTQLEPLASSVPGPALPQPAARTISLPQAEHGDACPYQQGGLCTAHATRPLGCRVFFCEGEGQGWQESAYEQGQARLQALHERFQVPYRYAEWRALLNEASEGLAALHPRDA